MKPVEATWGHDRQIETDEKMLLIPLFKIVLLLHIQERVLPRQDVKRGVSEALPLELLQGTTRNPLEKISVRPNSGLDHLRRECEWRTRFLTTP